MKILAKNDGACIKRVPKNRWGLQKRVARKWWGWQKSGGKKKGDSVIPYLVCDRQDFFASIFFFTPTVFLPPLFLPHHLFFAPFLFYRHYFFVTSFLLPVFSGKVFLEATAAATKFLVGVVAKKRWQKSGDKKEVVQR